MGSGAGFDAFLAARQVGETGSVIGVDMTAEMIAKARGNIAKTDLRNVEFRLGEIEHLPVADQSVDVIMSNCVINLSTDKPAVFREAYRVLTPGGRLAISDIVALREIPSAVRNDLEVYAGCVSGAALVAEVEGMLRDAGFEHVRVDLKKQQRRPGARLVARRRDTRGVRTHPRDKASSGRGPSVAQSNRRGARAASRPKLGQTFGGSSAGVFRAPADVFLLVHRALSMVRGRRPPHETGPIQTLVAAGQAEASEACP